MPSTLNIPFLTGDRNTDNNFLSIKAWGNSLITKRTPTSATDVGSIGQWCYDDNYIYVCIATNTWKRSALSTW